MDWTTRSVQRVNARTVTPRAEHPAGHLLIYISSIFCSVLCVNAYSVSVCASQHLRSGMAGIWTSRVLESEDVQLQLPAQQSQKVGHSHITRRRDAVADAIRHPHRIRVERDHARGELHRLLEKAFQLFGVSRLPLGV